MRLLGIVISLVWGLVSTATAATTYDVNGDGREGIAETIHSLQVAAGFIPAPPPGVFINSMGMEFRLIPAGSFIMGSPAGSGDDDHRPHWPSEPGRSTLEHQHIVTLTKPYYIQTTEITQNQWTQITGSNPSHFTNCGLECPVEQVSWEDVQIFVAALNAAEGRTNCTTTPNTCYSLPTEAQWEYAARAGSITAFYNGNITSTDCSGDPNLDKIGWYCANADNTTHPVAQKAPNDWGLYDMSGNVMEWCQDRHGNYPDGPLTDPQGPSSGQNRIYRGGNWNYAALYGRSAFRLNVPPSHSNNILGFRLSLSTGQ